MFKDKRNFIEYCTIFFIGVLLTAMIIFNFQGIKNSATKFFSVLTPFYIGFGIAYILNRPVYYISRKFKINLAAIIAITYLLLMLIITLFIVKGLPMVFDNLINLVNAISISISNLPQYLDQYNLGPIQSIIDENISKITDYLGIISTFLLNNTMKIFVSITSTLMNVFFGVIISIYMLADKGKLKKLGDYLITALFNREKGEKISEFLKEVNNIFSHFLSGLIVEAIIVGFLAFIGFSLMGVKYAAVLGLTLCMTNVIPYIGPFLGSIPAIIATLTYNPLKAIWVAIFIIILQQFDGNFIGPKVMGNYIGLDPLLIILAITIGGAYAGVLGILLAIPTAAILKIIFNRLIHRYELKRKTKQLKSNIQK
ncbi:AI-2E family transporter [Clostridium sp. DL1XJH146]